jgi:hypothetical protein
MAQDYTLTEGLDLMIEDGDFVVGESTQQHQKILLIAEKGELRQFPKTGVGAKSMLNDDEFGTIYQEIQTQFEADGMVIRKLLVNQDGTVEVTAEYK